MSGRLAFNLLLLAVPAYFVWSALGYEPAARRIPLLIGAVVLCLQAWVTARELRAGAAHAQAEEPPAGEGARVAAMCGWMLLFFALFATLGALAAILLFILAFLRSGGRLAWWRALAVSGAVAGALWLVFVRLMRFELYPGVLFGGTLPAF